MPAHPRTRSPRVAATRTPTTPTETSHDLFPHPHADRARPARPAHARRLPTRLAHRRRPPRRARRGELTAKPPPKSEFELYVANMSRQSVAMSTRNRKGSSSISTSTCSSPRRAGAGIAKDAKVRDQLALARLRVLVDAGLQKYLEAHPVQESSCGRSTTRGSQRCLEYHARHILVEDQAAAERSPKSSRRRLTRSSRPSARRTPPARAAATSAGSARANGSAVRQRGGAEEGRIHQDAGADASSAGT